MNSNRREIIIGILSFFAGAVVKPGFEFLTNKYLGDLTSDEAKLIVSITYGGLRDSKPYLHPTDKTEYVVFPTIIKLSNLRTMPFTIKTIVPFTHTDEYGSYIRFPIELLPKASDGNFIMDDFPEKTIKPLDTEVFDANTYIKKTELFLGTTLPENYVMENFIKVEVTGLNGTEQFAILPSFNLNRDGIMKPKTKSKVIYFNEEI